MNVSCTNLNSLQALSYSSQYPTGAAAPVDTDHPRERPGPRDLVSISPQGQSLSGQSQQGSMSFKDLVNRLLREGLKRGLVHG